jgi:hypothetical protein
LEQFRVSQIAFILTCFRALADVLHIYPFKANKKTFDENKDELGFSSKPEKVRKQKTAEQLEQERVASLQKEEYLWKSK